MRARWCVLGSNNLVSLKYDDVVKKGIPENRRQYHRSIGSASPTSTGRPPLSEPGARSRRNAFAPSTCSRPASRDHTGAGVGRRQGREQDLCSPLSKRGVISSQQQEDLWLRPAEPYWLHFITADVLPAAVPLRSSVPLASLILAVTVIVMGRSSPSWPTARLMVRDAARAAGKKAIRSASRKIVRAAAGDDVAYKKEKINPLPGCWPILIQILFFAVYRHLHLAGDAASCRSAGSPTSRRPTRPTTSFTLFGLILESTTLPVVGGPLHLGVWPVISGHRTMWVQMKLNRRRRSDAGMIFNWMPIIFTFVLGLAPAGPDLLGLEQPASVTQQWFIMSAAAPKWTCFATSRRASKRKPKVEAVPAGGKAS